MILIGIGANLPGKFGSPRAVCEAALEKLDLMGVRIVQRSNWYRSAPVPISDQPWYINGVASLMSDLNPFDLLQLLHQVEREFGRVRALRNEARVIDLDILAYYDIVESGLPTLPHPRLHERAFVLYPLAEVAPGWRHPVLERLVADLIAELPDGQRIEIETPLVRGVVTASTIT
ncbi:MAG: 2-amino-4-hydroxy-6-hydroxymethyldihydropteridine diphosphokinase [Alphaproteobacteria bacterium]|nr:2-amino-4-hydroxy-6-hydroxymethyldihydropteridine diphosphokinase [Alphaproteobacteria bacterium]